MSKKEHHQDALQRGLEKLHQSGIPTENLSPTIVAQLKDQLGKEYDRDLAAIFLLGRIADPAVLELLTSLEKTATDKEVKKEVRRSLFKLTQKGISAPLSEHASESLQRPILRLTPEIESYLSSVDGAGGRLVWLARPQAGSGIQLLQGMVSDREGLLQFGGALVRRKELRRMTQDIRKNHGITMISIPWEYGDKILYEGYEKAREMGRSGLESFSSLRAVFNPTRPRPLEHPVYNHFSIDEIRSGSWREQSRRLLDEPEFRMWVLDEDWVKPYLQQVEEAQESRLVLNPVQKEERLAGIVRDAVREIFFGERKHLFQRRMEDMALHLLETQRGEQARLALAVALELREDILAVLDISFLTGWIQQSLAFFLSQTKAKAAEEPSLIVKP